MWQNWRNVKIDTNLYIILPPVIIVFMFCLFSGELLLIIKVFSLIWFKKRDLSILVFTSPKFGRHITIGNCDALNIRSSWNS